MQNIKYSGIHFRKDDESGIAKITIYDETASTYVIENELVDLYTADKDYTVGEYEDYLHWTKLDPDDHDYTVYVYVETFWNPGSGGSHHIQIVNYMLNVELNDPAIPTQIITRHTDHAGETVTHTVIEDTSTTFYKQAEFDGDDLEDTFVLSGTQRAAEFIRMSVDGGSSWYYPNYFGLVWGSNATSYNNNTIDSNGVFGVVLSVPPITGTENVIIEYLPKADKWKLKTQINLPDDGIDYIDRRTEVRLMDRILEIS